MPTAWPVDFPSGKAKIDGGEVLSGRLLASAFTVTSSCGVSGDYQTRAILGLIQIISLAAHRVARHASSKKC